MEDLFYFTKAEIVLDDIERAAESAGYRCSYNVDSGRDLKVYFGGYIEAWARDTPESPLVRYIREDCWVWSEWSDWASLEPADQLVVAEYSPASSFMISYHVGSLPTLRGFLRRILETYGGWVGDYDWSRPYDLRNIDTLEFG